MTEQTRRQVLQTAAGAGLALLLPPVLADTSAPGDAKPAPEAWTDIGKAEDFVQGEPKRVEQPGGIVLYVTRQAKDKDGKDALIATSAKCTHRGCEVGWEKSDSQFQCPCHNAAFAQTGKNVRGTRRSPDKLLPDLPTLPVRQKDGQVEVDIQAVPAAELEPQ